MLHFSTSKRLDTRQASVHLCIRAEGDQCVRVAVVFRGMGVRLKAVELAVYESLKALIAVYFQLKAWICRQIALPWLDQFQAETTHLGQRLLGMDQHGPQIMGAFQENMSHYDTFPHTLRSNVLTASLRWITMSAHVSRPS